MTAQQALSYLQREIHTVIAATTDEEGRPVTCAIDIMDADAGGVYFLTARGKGFCRRLRRTGYLALTGVKGEDTLSCVAVSVRGRVRELGGGPLPRLLEQNPYMHQIYPTARSQQALTVFCLYQGTGEWFDLSRQPVGRFSFSFGGAQMAEEGYRITGACTGCRACAAVCPQNCIDFTRTPAVIRQANCLHCGACQAACPHGAVREEGLA